MRPHYRKRFALERSGTSGPHPFFHLVRKAGAGSVLFLIVAVCGRIGKSVPNRDDEALGHADGFGGIFGTYRVFRSGFVVRRFLKVIGGSEIASEAATKTRIFVGELMKLDLHTSMGFRNAICALEDQGLRGMKLGIIGETRRLPRNTNREYGLGVLKGFSSIREIGGGLGFHRSTPSLRISRISGEEVLRQLSAG